MALFSIAIILQIKNSSNFVYIQCRWPLFILIFTETSSTEEMYECVGHPDLDHDQDSLESDPDVPKEVKKRPSAMDLTSTSNGRRSMWSELPEVLDSGILDNITCEAKKLHEAMFEVITSEASYLKSLNILMKHFAQSPKLSGIGNDQFLYSMKKFLKFWRKKN